MSQVNRLLFVCAGNICRSPMAEALFRHMADGHPELEQIEVGSAGTIALNGNLPCTDSVEVMRSYGLEIAAHRARPLSRRLPADLVLAMDRRTEQDARAMRLSAQVEMLGDFVGTGEEVVDPYGRSPRRYKAVAEQLHRMIGQVVERLDPEPATESDESEA